MIKHPINWFHRVLFFKCLIRVWNLSHTNVIENWDVAQPLWRHRKRNRRVRTERQTSLPTRWWPTNANYWNTIIEEGHSRNMGESWVLKPSQGCSEWKQMERFHLLISNTRPPHPSPRYLLRLTPPAVAGPPQLWVQPDSSDKRRFELTLGHSHYMLLCDWRELLSALGSSAPLLA